MDELYAIHFSGDHLAHYGRKGMKWGQNIFQTEYEGTGRRGGGNSDSDKKEHKSSFSGPERTQSDWVSRTPETERRKFKEISERQSAIEEELRDIRAESHLISKRDVVDLFNSEKVQSLIEEYTKLIDARYNMLEAEVKSGVIPAEIFSNQSPPYFEDVRKIQHQRFDDWIYGRFSGMDPDFLDTVKEQNELKKEKEQLDNALLSISDTVSKLSSEAKKLVFQSDSVQEAIRRYHEILNSQYDFEIDVMKDEGASPKKIESTENLRDSDLLRFDISLAKVFFDGDYEAFEKESKKLDRKRKRADRIDEFKDDVGDLISSIKDKIDDSKIADEIGDIISDLKDKLKHEDPIESTSMQSINIAPIRGDSYMIHFSGEVEDEYLAHVGVKRRSGRYPWGSGDRPYQGESQAFQDRASAGKISKYEKKRLKEENKAQVERVKAAAAYAKAERKAAERATKATQAADKQLDKDFDRQQKRVEAEEKLKDKQNKDEVKAINQLSGKMLTPAQQAQLALANMDSMSNQDLKNMLDRIDYQQKLSAIASAEKTKGQKIMSNLGNAVLDVAVKQLIPGAGKVFVEYGQSKLREALDIPEPAKKDDKQNTQSKQKK